ncbi:MAG: hypothetical protein WAR24_20300 [Candidatus Acidiferrales bacterium]
MKPIRVLVANQPRLMRELVLATISEQPDIEIVGEIRENSEIKRAVDQTQPDFLIVALEESDRLSESCQLLLEKYPHMKILAIAPDRNTTIFYWASLNILSNRIEASEVGVLNTLRGKPQLADRVM